MTNILVNTKQGVLKGGVSKTENDVEYLEFLEIPYAKPPIGDLRFKSPQSPDSWEGERLATVATKKPSQAFASFNIIAGTEDCLYLNVFTPKLQPNNDKLLPVMVWIHGGGFAFGNGTIKEEAGPDHFIGQDVILVYINYRLNVFGFLSLDIPEAAGNMGLKDQVMALKWVQENIAAFGGDKDNVTLYGVSAGGASIEYLMLSPMSKGLFHKAIIQSGSSLNQWAITFDPKLIAYELAQQLGFQGLKIDYRGIYHHIFKYSRDEIQTAFMKLLDAKKKLRTQFCFVPCVEKDFGDNEAFLIDNPYNILKQGKFNRVPVLRGFCDSEGMLSKILTPLGVKELEANKNFHQFWPYELDGNYKEKLMQAYLTDGHDFSLEFFSDFDFVAGIWIATKFMADRIPVYMYENSYNGDVNFVKRTFGVEGKGCFHGDDSSYVLKIPKLDPKTNADKLIRDRLVMMWTNFAKSGNPTPELNETMTLNWPKFTRKDMTYLNIDINLTLKSNYEPKRMELFEEIYNKYKK